MVFRLREGTAVWREVDGEAVVLDVDAAEYLAANATGTLLWRAMATGATRGQLAAALSDAYGIDAAEAAQDVDDFVVDCRGRGFLED